MLNIGSCIYRKTFIQSTLKRLQPWNQYSTSLFLFSDRLEASLNSTFPLSLISPNSTLTSSSITPFSFVDAKIVSKPYFVVPIKEVSDVKILPNLNDGENFDNVPRSDKNMNIDDDSSDNFVSRDILENYYTPKVEYEMMNRNARRPKKANHGKRPNCNVMRKLKRHNRKIKLTR